MRVMFPLVIDGRSTRHPMRGHPQLVFLGGWETDVSAHRQIGALPPVM
jgi:hypothetical protein